MHILGNLLVGLLSVDYNLTMVSVGTTVISTNLAYTPELSPFLYRKNTDLAALPAGWNLAAYQSNLPLARAVEQLFQNITLSLLADLSSCKLLKAKSRAFLIPALI